MRRRSEKGLFPSSYIIPGAAFGPDDILSLPPLLSHACMLFPVSLLPSHVLSSLHGRCVRTIHIVPSALASTPPFFFSAGGRCVWWQPIFYFKGFIFFVSFSFSPPFSFRRLFLIIKSLKPVSRPGPLHKQHFCNRVKRDPF